MEEYAENGQRAHEAYQEKEDAKEAAANGAPVGKLVFHQALGNKPAQEQAGEKSAKRKEDLASNKVEHVEERLVAYAQTIKLP